MLDATGKNWQNRLEQLIEEASDSEEWNPLSWAILDSRIYAKKLEAKRL